MEVTKTTKRWSCLGKYPIKSAEVYSQLLRAYKLAKSAAFKLLSNNRLEPTGDKMNAIFAAFNLNEYEGHDVSEEWIDIMDKAEFVDQFGSPEEALVMLQQLAPKSAGEIQNMVLYRAAMLSTKISYIKGDLPWFAIMDSINDVSSFGGSGVGVGPTGSGCDVENVQLISQDYEEQFTLGGVANELQEKNIAHWSSENSELITINPNPVKDKLTITIDENTIGKTVRIVNISGSTVLLPQQLLTMKTVLDLSTLPTGIYFLQLFENNALITTEKIMLMK
jgi:hypothetical protein